MENDKIIMDRKKLVIKIRDLEKKKAEINKEIKESKNSIISLDNYLILGE